MNTNLESVNRVDVRDQSLPRSFTGADIGHYGQTLTKTLLNS